MVVYIIKKVHKFKIHLGCTVSPGLHSETLLQKINILQTTHHKNSHIIQYKTDVYRGNLSYFI